MCPTKCKIIKKKSKKESWVKKNKLYKKKKKLKMGQKSKKIHLKN